jgi:ELWxxDGT repeat protein
VIDRKGFIEPLERRMLLSASLVKDLNTGPGILPSVWDIENAGTITFLSAEETTAGWELYKSDGTPGGTTLVKDVRPGQDNSQPGWLTAVGNGVVFFSADDGVNGIELWKSDGTEAGTVLLKDINPGAAASSPGNLVNINGTLFFTATTVAGGNELWKSDGTTAGTVQVKDIYSGNTGSVPSQLINNNGTLFFRATTSASGAELWKSNGTDAGTVQVKELYNNNNSGMANVPMTVLNGYVYFAGTTSTSGTELWKSDGTDLGTTMVAELTASSSSTSLSNLKTSGTQVFFQVGNGTTGLYRTDGATTSKIAETPFGSVDVNGTLFFAIGTPGSSFTTNATLYTTTGSTPTTVKTGLTFRNFTYQYWANINGVLYFPADDVTGSGEELWRSNGTLGGTSMVQDINPGSAASGPGIFVSTGGSNFLFGATTASAGASLFKSDGTNGGTQFVKDINTATGDSSPIILTPYNGKMYFVAYVPGFGESGGELYSSDGTDAGTGIVIDLNPGIPGANINSAMCVYNGYLYFTATNGTTGNELWKTDGTAAGTSLVADINSGSVSSSPFDLTVSGAYLYFGATTAANGQELWRTDGTGAGTIRLTDVVAGSTTSFIDIWGESNGTLYFSGSNSTTMLGLSKSNGTTGTTGLLSSAFTDISSALNINGTLYLVGTTSANGTELFKTTSGSVPVLVKEIVSSSGSSSPQQLVNMNGTLYFTAITSGAGRELWKSDGTDPGTVLVKDINPGSGNSSPNAMAASNGVLYFRADNGVVGAELWRSDGTAAGTYLLKDIWPGTTSFVQNTSNPTRLFGAGGFVYFAAEDGVNGVEAWRSDGTPTGTVMIGDYFPENYYFLLPSNVRFFTGLGNQIFYVYSDDAHGGELWKIDPDFATLGGGGALTISATASNDVLDISSTGGGVTLTLNGYTQTFAPGAITSIAFAGRGGNDILNVNAGTLTFTTDAQDALATNTTINVASGANVVFNATQHLTALNLAGNATATFPVNGNRLLQLLTLSLASQSRLDLNDNDLVVTNSNFTTLQGLVFSGYSDGPDSTKTGIVSSRGQRAGGITILALFDNALAGFSDWPPGSGNSIAAGAIVGHYTLLGDTNMDGQVTPQDYTAGDSNLGTTVDVGISWFYGDTNFDGEITAQDYTAVDSALGTSLAQLPSALAAKSFMSAKDRPADILLD